MKNYENAQMVSLSEQELGTTNGGCEALCFTLIGVGLGILFSQDLDDLGAAFMEGYNDAR